MCLYKRCKIFQLKQKLPLLPSWVLFLSLPPSLKRCCPEFGEYHPPVDMLTMLAHLFLLATLWKGYYPHVTDEETETQGDQYLPRVTQQVGKRVEVQSQVDLTRNLCPFYCILHPEELVLFLTATEDHKDSSQLNHFTSPDLDSWALLYDSLMELFSKLCFFGL